MVKKISKKLSGAIIGPSGIGRAHLRELINFGFTDIAIVGKKFKKNRISDLIIKNKKISFYNFKSIEEIKKIKPKIINVCSPTKYHYDQIRTVKNFCKNLIVEKPILWDRSNKVSNLEITKNLLSIKSNNIYVNLPMISLAKQIKKKNKISKVKKFNFNYFTKGKNQFENIPIDLLPHALSFLLTLKSNKLEYFKIIRVLKKKNVWSCEIIINDCLCKFRFKQDYKRLDSRLSFRINDNIYLRKQVVNNGIYINKILKNKKKIFHIKNPMSDYLRLILKSLNKKNILKENNSLTINLVKIMEQLVDY